MTLATWLSELQKRFDERKTSFLLVHHARIQVQLKDADTGCIHIHEIIYHAKNAPEFKIQGEPQRTNA